MVEKERVAGSAFGALLRRRRLAAGLSQEDLAEQARMSARGIGALERGDRQYPYRETVVLLAKALGLTPAGTAEFEAAAARPRQQRTFADPGAAAPNGRSITTNLPLQRTSLIGRESEIVEIVGILQESRLVTVTGAGGVGKTRMALAVGDALLEDTKDGVWFVELAPLAQGTFVPAAVAQALNVQESPNRPLVETLLAYLKQKSLLLILDNCEHVIAEAATLADALLRGCRNLRIVATSREPLRIAGEQTYRLPSLQVPTPAEIVRLSAAAAAGYAALVLFAQRARAIEHGFALNDDNAPIVAEICRRLDGIPLAIELAAARVNILPVRALSMALDQRLRILTRGDRTALPRHQTMRALIDWSYDLLLPPEQLVFERLSVFAGGCTLEAAIAVCGDEVAKDFEILDLLSLLVDKSLVVADLGGREPRYRLLDSSRQYGFEKLLSRGEADAVAHRHALAYLCLAERHQIMNLNNFSTWPEMIEFELENWRAALDWAFSPRGEIVLGQRLVGALTPLWARWCAEGRRWINTALELVDERTPENVTADLEFNAAHVAQFFGEWEVALAGSQRAIKIYQRLGESYKVTNAQNIATSSLVMLDRISEAEPMLQSALAAARSLDNFALVAAVLDITAFVCSKTGKVFEARQHFMEAIEIFRSAGLERFAARVTMNLAHAEFSAGNFEQAVQISTEALPTLRENQASFVSVALCALTGYLIACNRWDEAREHALEAVDLTRETQQHYLLTWTLQHLAAVVVLTADGSDARSSETKIAARLLGYVDASSAALGTPRQDAEQQEYDRVLTALRNSIGADQLASLLADGATMTEDQAVSHAEAINECRTNAFAPQPPSIANRHQDDRARFTQRNYPGS